ILVMYTGIGTVGAYLHVISLLIDFFHGWPTMLLVASVATWHAARHSSGHATRHSGRSLRGRAVHLGHDGRADALHVLQLVLVLLLLRQRVVVEPLERVVARVPRRALVLFRELVSGLVQRLLHAEHVRLELVPRRYALPLLLVLILVLLGLGEHALDLGLRQASLVVLDHDVLASAGAVLFGRHVEDAVRVQVEGDVDLRDAARRGRDAGQVERAQQVVVLGHRSLALVHLDRDRRLVVRVRGERLRLLARDLTVALDDLRHHAAGGFDAEGQRGHVHQQHVLDLRVLLAAQDGRLDGRAVRDRLVRVDGEVQLLAAEEVLQQTLHLRDPGGASDEDDVVDLALVHLGVLERLLDRLEGASEQVCVELFEARAGHASVEVDSLVERVDLDGGFGAGRQRALSALGGCAEAAQCARIHAHVLLVLALELVREMVHQSVVEVLASEMRVARRRPHFEQRAFVDGQDRHVERSAAEVEDEDVPLALEVLVEAVRERSGCGLVDDPEHVQPGDGSRVLGGLALRVVEVRRHCDHRVATMLLISSGANRFRFPLELHLDLRFAAVADHPEGPVFHVCLDLGVVEFPSDQSLGVEHRVVGVEGDLVLGCVSDEALRVREGHIGWCGAVALVVGDDLHVAVLPHADARGIGVEFIFQALVTLTACLETSASRMKEITIVMAAGDSPILLYALGRTGDDFVDEKAILARRMHSLRVVTELSKAPTCGQIASVGADSFDETDTSRPTTNARPNVGTNAIF
ncbi:hypothetical protein SFRURICE_011344, partial [Spodoptera frugiperda]